MQEDKYSHPGDDRWELVRPWLVEVLFDKNLSYFAPLDESTEVRTSLAAVDDM